LEREIARLARKALRRILEKKDTAVVITPENLDGRSPACASSATACRTRKTRSAAVTGLAWTEVGGELLTIESVDGARQGRGASTTGKLGEVMSESVQMAFSFVKARSPALWHPAFDFQAQGPAHPLARRRRAQGRAECRRRHGHGDGLHANRHPGARAMWR